jgi:hypothetical protein
LRNPFWQYSRDKIACEDLLVRAYRDDGFPVTIIRPSSTYDRTRIVLTGGWTDIARLRAGKPVVVHGDGTSLWTVTHSSDLAKALVGLLGLPQAVGDSFTITSDEYLPWNTIYQLFAQAAGAPPARLVHIASETIAAAAPQLGPSLLGDRSHSVIFDNSKVKALVPDFVCTTPFATGVRDIIDWYDANPDQQIIDHDSRRDLRPPDRRRPSPITTPPVTVAGRRPGAPDRCSRRNRRPSVGYGIRCRSRCGSGLTGTFLVRAACPGDRTLRTGVLSVWVGHLRSGRLGQ